MDYDRNDLCALAQIAAADQEDRANEIEGRRLWSRDTSLSWIIGMMTSQQDDWDWQDVAVKIRRKNDDDHGAGRCGEALNQLSAILDIELSDLVYGISIDTKELQKAILQNPDKLQNRFFIDDTINDSLVMHPQLKKSLWQKAQALKSDAEFSQLVAEHLADLKSTTGQRHNWAQDRLLYMLLKLNMFDIKYVELPDNGTLATKVSQSLNPTTHSIPS